MQICSNDNLDLGCALIKKAVREKAIEDSNNDTVIQESLEKRKSAKEKGEVWAPSQDSTLEGVKNISKLLIQGNELFKIYDEFNNTNKKNVEHQQHQQYH